MKMLLKFGGGSKHNGGLVFHLSGLRRKWLHYFQRMCLIYCFAELSFHLRWSIYLVRLFCHKFRRIFKRIIIHLLVNNLDHLRITLNIALCLLYAWLSHSNLALHISIYSYSSIFGRQLNGWFLILRQVFLINDLLRISKAKEVKNNLVSFSRPFFNEVIFHIIWWIGGV